MTRYAGSVVNSQEYGKQVAANYAQRCFPMSCTAAAFDHAGFNGRPLGDDVMDVMLTLASNMPLADGVGQTEAESLQTFPDHGSPYVPLEQAKVIPFARPPAQVAVMALKKPLRVKSMTEAYHEHPTEQRTDGDTWHQQKILQCRYRACGQVLLDEVPVPIWTV